MSGGPAAGDGPGAGLRARAAWPWALAALVCLAAAISAESLWIDELTSAWLAAQRGPADLFRAMAATGSEAQMPGFCLYLWAWSRLFGLSEIALRGANLPWAVLAVLSFGALLARIRCRPAAMLLLVSPIVCAYMNEARPYALSVAAGALALAGVEALASAPAGAPARRAAAAAVAGVLLGAAGSMLNLFLAPALAVYAVVRLGLRDAGRLAREHAGAFAVAVAGCAALAGYYAWTLAGGHGGQRDSFAPANAAFALYEWLGLGGLGPAREALRTGVLPDVWRGHVPWLAAGTLAWAVAAGAGLAAARRVPRDRVLAASALGFAAGAALLGVAAGAASASLWGRHFLCLYPLAAVAVARALLPVPQAEQAGPGGRTRFGIRCHSAAAAFLIAVLAASTARQRLVPLYRKDPYREAAAEVKRLVSERPGRPVIWVGYVKALWYYGLSGPGRWKVPDRSAGFAGNVRRDGLGLDRESGWALAREAGRFILVVHRPDQTDPAGAWTHVLERARRAELAWARGGIRIYDVDTGDGPED